MSYAGTLGEALLSFSSTVRVFRALLMSISDQGRESCSVGESETAGRPDSDSSRLLSAVVGSLTTGPGLSTLLGLILVALKQHPNHFLNHFVTSCSIQSIIAATKVAMTPFK